MSTELYDSPDFSLTQFFGGVDRGRCVQITTAERPSSYVSLSVEAATRLVVELEKWLETCGAPLPRRE